MRKPTINQGAIELNWSAGLAALQSHLPKSDIGSHGRRVVEAVAEAVFSAASATPEIATEQFGIRSNVFANKVTRWPGVHGLRITAVEVSPRQPHPGDRCTIEIELVGDQAGAVAPVVSVLIMTRDGRDIARLLSPPTPRNLAKDEKKTIRAILDPVMLEPQDFIFSVALFQRYDPVSPENAVRHEILSRSFELTVVGQRSEAKFSLPHAIEVLPAR